jgi:hypothetical protein
MAKKIRYVPLDWSSAPDTGPFTSLTTRHTATGEATDCAGPEPSTVRNENKKVGGDTPELHTSCTTPSDAEKLSSASHRVIQPASAETPLLLHSGTSESILLPRLPTGKPSTSPLVISSPAPDSSPSVVDNHSSSTTALAVVPQWTESLLPRKSVHIAPIPGKVYFVPDGRHFPDSVIHHQKQHSGFFQHPVLIVDTDGDFVYFYGMTKEPPKAMRDLDMALRIGATREDDGLNVLRLAPDSDIMLQATWVNLEQRFFIEWRNLDEWAVDVRVHPDNLSKITCRISQLEADQNRFIYKPLLRDMSTIQPGTIIMLPNALNASTLGAPVLVIESTYPSFRFLRVKRFTDNINFNPLARRRKGSSRAMSLGISTYPSIGHDGTPILFTEPDSPEMREESYVEIDLPFKYGELDQCRTWCWPPVKISVASMAVLHSYIANVAVRRTQDAMNGYYPQFTHYVHGACSTIPPSGYYTYPPQTMPAYPPGSYISSSDTPTQRYTEPGSEHTSICSFSNTLHSTNTHQPNIVLFELSIPQSL